jgi:hypothetical protein
VVAGRHCNHHRPGWQEELVCGRVVKHRTAVLPCSSSKECRCKAHCGQVVMTATSAMQQTLSAACMLCCA